MPAQFSKLATCIIAPGNGSPSSSGSKAGRGKRAWIVDLLIALGVFLYNLPNVPIYAGTPSALIGLLVISTVLCVAYFVRHRYPRIVLGVMLLAACVQLLFNAPVIPADVLLLFALYSVAVHFRWWVSLPGALGIIGWLLLAVVPHLGDELINIGQLSVLLVFTLWVWTWGTLVRIRRQYIASLQDRTEQAERERQTQAKIAVAQERARIAREIHDIVSHSLSVVVVMSEGAAAKVDSDPQQARTAMLQVSNTGRTALAEMRRMLGVLRDNEPGSHAPQPNLAQLDALIAQARAVGMPVTLSFEGPRTPLTPGAELTVYRIVQEALTNIRKHAGPNLTSAEVRLIFRPDEVELRITDDGQGLAKELQAGAGGHGLLGMRERVGIHGGTFQAGTRQLGGFEVVAVLPRTEGES